MLKSLTWDVPVLLLAQVWVQKSKRTWQYRKIQENYPLIQVIIDFGLSMVNIPSYVTISGVPLSGFVRWTHWLLWTLPNTSSTHRNSQLIPETPQNQSSTTLLPSSFIERWLKIATCQKHTPPHRALGIYLQQRATRKETITQRIMFFHIISLCYFSYYCKYLSLKIFFCMKN